MKPVVSIIIVNWNGLPYLGECLDSLREQTFRDFEVILVDNGSGDGSVEFLETSYPEVRLITFPTNLGFAGGNNAGFAKARGEYIVTLNNDTRADPEWLETLVAVAEEHRRVGMVGSRVCSYADPDIIDSIGMGICRDGMSRGRFRNKRWSSLQLQEVEEILFPSACAALYRREMLEETGFFDDDFFAYAEDSDLGLRGRLAGWGAVAATGAVVRHRYSQTSGVLSPFKVYLVERNHYWVVWKSFPLSQILALPLFTLWRYGGQVRAVLAGGGTGGEFRAGGTQGALAKALIRGIWDGFRAIPQVLRKRRQVMDCRELSMREFGALLKRHRITFRELLDCE